LTVPVASAGATAFNSVGPTYVTDDAGLEPKLTWAWLTNPVPLSVTVLPPETRPASGLTLVTVGGPNT
jgi:hypothetical protein